MNYSPITEVLILSTWGITPWYVFYTFKRSGHSALKVYTLTAFVVGWSLLGFGIAKYGIDLSLGINEQVRPLIYVSLASIFTWVFRKSLVGHGLSQNLLIGLQVFRPLGLVFLIEHARGNLPGVFAHPAGWGDLAVGLLAIYVTWTYRDRVIPAPWVKAVFWLGMIDFASAFFFGFTSSPSPVQLFAFDRPNQAILYPTGLIPLFLVPYAIIFHILSITELKRSQTK